ncbi:RES family NAD+ phosphorylase [Chryseobacterium indologenes]|uniref:RES family NAD+ phosphorylase n=1 Tax=Chryseobacterium indologenes TaxID=253 RepID=UPI001031BA3B|nr:RES family NAD+ phosphorylase [Chryseobacterium indologenes]
MKIQTYLAEEFAKEDITANFDYMILAIFSEIATKNGFDGIIFPSVRVSGEGFNIAITPKATKKLRLIVAGECSLYKHKDRTVIGNDAIIELNGDEEEFDMIELPNNDQTECLNKIVLQNLDELKKLQML